MKKALFTLLFLSIAIFLLNIFIFNKNVKEDTSSFYKVESPQKEKPLNPWSNDYLWKSFVNTKSYATFSAKINDKLPLFNFKILGKLIKNPRIGPDYEYFLPSYVEIYDSSKSKLIQKLSAKNRFDNDGYCWDIMGYDYVQIVDVNFDGYLDLRLFYNAGATGNNWYAIYL